MKNSLKQFLRLYWKHSLLLILLAGINLGALYAQTVTVRGQITDAKTNEPVPGVNIVENGTTNGTISDIDGNYQLEVSQDATVVYSFIGFKNEAVPAGNGGEINVALEAESTALDEVVAIGYGSVRKRDLTGSVSSVSGSDLQKVPITSVGEALKGRLPGVNILTTDGSPDAEIVVRVRGGGSVTQDNSPLYVVDGFIVSSISDIPPNDIASISVLKDAAATAIYGAQAANGVIVVTTKSPTSQTRVTYNGYMQIKHLPEERKLDVLDPYEFVFAHYEKAKLTSDADLRRFEKFYGKYDDLELYKYKKPMDWQDEVFGNDQISQSHNLSLSGGTEKTKINLSLSNNQNEGIMVGNDYTRNVVNFKLNHKVAESLTFDATARITDTEVNGAGTSGSAQLRVRDVITARPVNGIADELDIDLTDLNTSDDYQSFLLSMINPTDLAEQDWRRRTTNSYDLSAGLTWEPIENLDLKSTIYSRKRFEERRRYYGPLTSQSQQEGNSLPLGTKEDRKSDNYRWVNTAQYKFDNLGAHDLDIMLGHEMFSSGGSSSFARSENFRESMQPEELFANMQLGDIVQYSTAESTKQSRLSFFSRVNYQFADKYMFTGTIRSDASSKFSKENRVGIFPAAALAWKVSEESFLSGADFLNELKLRASYGQTGNDRIDLNAFKFVMTADDNNGPGMGTNDYNVYYKPYGSTLYNPDLIWETTTNRNLGLDYMFFNGRLRGSFDAYYNTTKDLLLKAAIPPNSGFEQQWDNMGSTSNRGLELNMDGYIIDRPDFTLSANVNFGLNRSRIEELEYEYLTDNEGNLILDESGNKIPASRFYQSNWASTDLKDRDDFYLEVGQTIGLIYGYRNDGMYTVDDFAGYDEASGTYILNDGVVDNSKTLGVNSLRPGYMKIKDISGPNGEPDGVIDSNDREIIGNALPDLTGGFGLNLTFKGFDATMLFNFSIGNDIYNTGKIEYNQMYRTSFGNMLESQSSSNRYTYIDVDGSYTGTAGEVVTDLEQLREMNAGKNTWSGSNSFGTATAVVTDWAIEDGSFLRFNTLTVGYTVPQRITERVGMSQFRVYASAYNLWVWTNYSGYDPEVSTTRSSSYAALTPGVDFSAYPRSRSLTLGVNITF